MCSLSIGVGRGEPEVYVTKEQKSAAELSDMIYRSIGVSGIQIDVRADHAYGWQPMVYCSSRDGLGLQRRAEEIAHQLRHHYELR